MKTPEAYALLLLQKAAHDLVVCERGVDDSAIADEVFGFHAQQAVEKALKAVLTSRGIEYRRTHDVRELLDALADNGVTVPEQFAGVDEWTPYGVQYRYESFDEGDMPVPQRRRSCEVIRQVLAWARTLIPQPPVRTTQSRPRLRASQHTPTARRAQDFGNKPPTVA
jgi:HEPN domain-containing protein